MKTTLTMFGVLLLITGCTANYQSTSEKMTSSVLPIPEVVWLRQVHNYSDFANFSTEELPYLQEKTKSQKSDFGIDLTFDLPNGRAIHTVYFDTASSKLRPSEKHKLNAIIQNLDGTNVYLSGYADPRGSDSYNDKLSKARVAAVNAYLKEHGLNVERKCAYGESKIPDYQLCEEGVSTYE